MSSKQVQSLKHASFLQGASELPNEDSLVAALGLQALPDIVGMEQGWPVCTAEELGLPERNHKALLLPLPSWKVSSDFVQDDAPEQHRAPHI